MALGQGFVAIQAGASASALGANATKSKSASEGTVTPNPSVKGTSCAKAQAAPYLER